MKRTLIWDAQSKCNDKLVTKCLRRGFCLPQYNRMSVFGRYLAMKRQALQAKHGGFSLRAVASRIGIHHSYLSKIERGEETAIRDERIVALAHDLGEDEEILLAMAGRLTERISRLVGKDPQRFMECIEQFEVDSTPVQGQSEYSRRLAHRKDELDTLTRRLKDEIRERQILEKQLKQAEQRWRFALEGAQQGVWDWDASTNKAFFSSSWKSMLGYDYADIGDTLDEWESLIHPDDYDAVMADLMSHMRGETPVYENEHRLRCKDGSWKWILDRGVVVERDKQGKPLRAIGTHQDMTERHEAEDRVRRSEAFLQSVMGSMQEGISVLGPDKRVHYINPVLELWHGPAEKVLGKHCHEVFHGQMQSCQKCPASRVRKSGKAEWGMLEVHTLQGPRTVEVHCYPINDGPEHVVGGVVEFVRDVTERERMKKAMSELEGRYRTLFEKNNTVQLLIDPQDGRILDANKAAEDFYGYGVQQLKSMYIGEINILDKDEIAQEMAAALHEQRNFFNFRHRLANGEVRHVESRSTPVWIQGRQLLHSLITDVTERFHLQRRQALENARLQSLVETLPDVCCLKDAKGRWQALNSAGRSLLGLNEQQYLGRTFDQIEQQVSKDRRPLLQLVRAFEGFDSSCGRRSRTSRTLNVPGKGDRTFDVMAVPVCTGTSVAGDGLVVVARDVTELVAQGIRTSQLAAIIDNTNNICVIKGLDLRVIAANRAFAKAAGVDDVSELVGRTDAEIFGLAPSEQPVRGYMEDERLVQSYAQGQVLERDEEVRYPDGSVHIVHTRKFPVFDANGTLTATANISADVTDFHRVRQQAMAAEHRYRELVERAPIGILTLDDNGMIQSMNAAHAILYGYASPAEMLSAVPDIRATYADVDDRERLLAMMDYMDVVRDFEHLARKKDGSSFWVSKTVQPVRDECGEVEFFEVFVEDVQARKQAELSTEAARRQLLKVLEQLEAGVYVLDPLDRTIIYANRFLKEAMSRELVGQISNEVLLKDSATCVFCLDSTTFSKLGDSRTRELLFANDRWYHCTAKLTEWGFGMNAVLVVAKDITEIKRAEAMKEDVDRILRHDLKSPLGGIITLPQMLLEEGECPEHVRDVLEAISSAGRKMQNLIDASLSLYKLEMGTYEVVYRPIDIGSEVDRLRMELVELIRAKRLQLVCRVEENDDSGVPDCEAGQICGDATLIPFLLSNLVKNAVESAPDKTTVLLRAHCNATQRIIIHNQGTVPEAVRECFFDKYATANKHGGTGLGTYSALLVAKAHGGTVEMHTSEADGTTVTVTLPADNSRHCQGRGVYGRS